MHRSRADHDGSRACSFYDIIDMTDEEQIQLTELPRGMLCSSPQPAHAFTLRAKSEGESVKPTEANEYDDMDDGEEIEESMSSDTESDEEGLDPETLEYFKGMLHSDTDLDIGSAESSSGSSEEDYDSDELELQQFVGGLKRNRYTCVKVYRELKNFSTDRKRSGCVLLKSFHSSALAQFAFDRFALIPS